MRALTSQRRAAHGLPPCVVVGLLVRSRPSHRAGSPPVLLSTHRFEDHTGELGLSIEARSLPALFAEAGRALAELALGSDPLPKADAGRDQWIDLEAGDRERLFLAWLNELIFRTEVDHVVFVEFDFDELTDLRLSARVRGATAPSARTFVKAATFHDLECKEDENGFAAHVVLDV